MVTVNTLYFSGKQLITVFSLVQLFIQFLIYDVIIVFLHLQFQFSWCPVFAMYQIE